MPAPRRNNSRSAAAPVDYTENSMKDYDDDDDDVEMEEDGYEDDEQDPNDAREEEEDDDEMQVDSSSDDEEEDEEEEEKEEPAPRPRRRSTRDKTSRNQGASSLRQQQQSNSVSGRRTSSRANKFTSSMAEPTSKSIRDLLPQGMTEYYVVSSNDKKSSSARAARRSANSSSSRSDMSTAASDDDDDDEDDDDVYEKPRRHRRTTTTTTAKPRASSPHKSPARRHKQRRYSLKHEIAPSDQDDDDEDDGGELSYASSSAAASSQVVAEEEFEEDEDEEPLKIQRILASRTETRRKWHEICQSMNTSEIDFGSRWFQAAGKSSSSHAAPYSDKDGDVFEERFLVKWADLGYLHCSWETQKDLVEQIDGAKTYLTTFFRKSHNGLLFTADERCDGDYFDPAYTEIDRILEVQLPEGCPGDPKMDPDLEDSYNESSFGMIMDKKDPNFEEGTGRQFLIKWANLPYSQATYEFERDLILCDIDYKEAVKSFLKRAPKPSKRTREAFLRKGVEEQKRLFKIFGDKSSLDEASREKAVEKYKRELQERVYKNGGQLRDYQGEGVAWMISNFVNQRSCILADEMGLGKTLQTAAFVDILLTKMNRGGPVLVIVPLSTIAHWYREFTNWTDLNAIVYHGSSEDRDHIRQLDMAYEANRPQGGVGFNQLFLCKCLPKRGSKAESPWMFDVLITTPEMIVADDFAELTAIQWEVLVVDEAHRLKNHNSKLAVSLRDKRFKFEHKLLLTGTPIQNSVEEFWSLLNLMEPDKFDDAEEFMELYGDMKSKERVDQLHEEIRPYILRRLKEDVEKSVPEKSETLIEVELTIQQKQWYRALYEKNVRFLHKNKKKALDGPGLNNLAMELRKCCNHLFLLRGVEEEIRREQTEKGEQLPEGDFLAKASGKLVLLDKLLPRLKEEGHRVLIFSQFKIMLDILEDYLNARDMKFERIDGSITGHRRQQAIDRFQAPASEGREPPFIMMLSTRAGGVGINLTAADTCIIFDSDFNPQNDLQAQARCHRIGQTKTVKVYRLLTRKTYEMQMFHMSSLKMGLDQAVLKGFETGSSSEGALSKEEVEKLLRHGAYDIFNEDKAGTAEAESNDFVQQDIDSILERRSRTVVHENTGSNSNAAGGTFSKARFTATAKSPDTADKNKARANDVDIEDPEFWTKVLGDSANPAADDDMTSKPRQRSKANYSEREYQRQLEAALRLDSGGESDSSDNESEDQDDEENEGGERMRWGGAGPSEWKKDDADTVLKALMTYGYGLKSWDEFQASFQLSKEYSSEEIKRMSWSLILTTIVEAASDDAESAKKRDERAAQKRREASLDNREEGGVLAGLPKRADHLTSDEEEKAKSFEKLLQGMSKWSARVLDDAISFAKDHEARETAMLDKLTSNTNKQQHKLTADGISSKFAESVWPSLKGRGWNAVVYTEGDSAGRTRYVYKEKEFPTIEATLVHAREQHPELSAMIDTLLSSIESNRQLSMDSVQQERTKHLAMTPENIDIGTLFRFLELYAPIQLLVDRQKSSSNKLRLSKRLLSTCSLMKTASDLVAQAKNNRNDAIDMDYLEESLTIDKRTSLPHPLWTSRHDTILITSIAKHGWIDHERACRAIVDDSSIKWGPPFDSVKDATMDIPPASPELVATANRAANFLSSHHTSLVEAKGFNDERIVRTYGLYRDTDEDGQIIHKWKVDEEKLRFSPEANKSGSGQELAELPTKKELVKRAKVLLTRGAHASSASESKGPEKSSYGYTLLDQSDRCNVFLAEIMRGVLKTPQSSKFLKTLLAVSLQEARKLMEGTAPMSTGDDASRSAHTDLSRILYQLQTVREHISKTTTQCKNIIRVMLGEEPLKPKNSGKDDVLFPKAKMLSLSLTKVAQPAREKEISRPVSGGATGTRTARPTGETAIDSARKKMKEIYSNPGKLASLHTNSAAVLELTEIETLLLSILCMYGVPPSSNVTNTAVMISPPEGNEIQGELTWRQLGRQLAICARAEEAKASNTLNAAKAAHDAGKIADGTIAASNLRDLLGIENDFVKKNAVVAQAEEYMSEPDTLAKKALMLIAKVRQQWGSTSVSTFTEKSYHGLGTKTLIWFDREVVELARAQDLLDEKGKPLGFTAVDFINDVSDEERAKIQISSLLDKKGCRNVMGQIAMMTRLRSLMNSWQGGELSNKVQVAVTRIISSGDVWEHEPYWWRSDESTCEHDDLLLDLLAKVGLTDELLERFSSTENKATGSNGRNVRLTRLSLQYRANQLIRELHRLSQMAASFAEKDRPNVIFVPKPLGKKSSSARGSVHQTGLDSFFSKKEAKPATNVLVDLVSGQEKDNVIVVVDSDSSASANKRKADESHQMLEKKLRPN